MMTMTTVELDQSDIRALQREAAAAGDLDMVRTCRVACGDEETSTQGDIVAALRVVAACLADAGARS